MYYYLFNHKSILNNLKTTNLQLVILLKALETT